MKKLILICLLISSLGINFVHADKNSNNKIITEFYGIFNDGTEDNFHKSLALKPPFKSWDITYIAFIHTYEKDGYWVADYENARGGQKPASGDTDKDRIKELMQRSTDTSSKTNPKNFSQANPDMKFIISLGWGKSDFSNGAKNPVQFAQSVCRIIKENNLDGFDVDFESDSLSDGAFESVSKELRTQMNALAETMNKKLYLSISPNNTGLNFSIMNKYYDLVQMQSYDYPGDGSCNPYDFMNQGIDSEKLIFGRDIENGDTLDCTRYTDSDGKVIGNVPNFVNKNKLGGIMGWRVNCKSQMDSEFDGVVELGNAFKESRL